MAKTLETLQVSVSLILICLLVWAPVVSGASAGVRITESIETLQDMAKEPDARAMATLLQKAQGVAIFPSVIKAGVLLGGKYGEGLVIQRNQEDGTWYGPSFITMKGVSYGLQFGVQSTALVLVINNEKGMESFRGTQRVTLGGDIGVAAGPVGRQAGASTDVDLQAAIYSYSISKGIFAGFSLEGAVIEADEDANHAYWGKPIGPRQILGIEATDRRMESLLEELENLMALGN
ncbi:MAG: lipid-binding SYLF domain-containing protein [Firmicutes bacterium]|nr:lipid-binding SYLF domain-containing protein [Bacillota bacterium]